MKAKDQFHILNLFNEVATTYDLLNDLLSLGLHRLWKRQLLMLLKPASGENWIDICCGTGDLAISLAGYVSPGGSVLGIDSASGPLALARQRAIKKSIEVSWFQTDALNTDLEANKFDGAVMGYGLRNLEDPGAGLLELRRLLRKDARAGVLDFNRLPDGSLAERFQKLYLRKVVVPIASQFGLRDHYAYLEKSLKVFPDGKSQEKLAYQAGFTRASHRSLAGGQMGILLLRN